jgi:biopolymer transport protein ExbB
LAAVSACSFVANGDGPSDALDAARAVDAVVHDGPSDSLPDAGSGSSWWNAAWKYRRPIDIDISGLTLGLEGFPVLVQLPQTFDYAHVLGTGSDLRFVSDDGSVELPHDTDTFDTKGSYVWVSVTLPPDTGTNSTGRKRIWLYYGNPAAADDAMPAAVWADDISVHHMADGDDASTHGHTGAPVTPQTAPKAMPGLVGAALVFDGKTTALSLPVSTAYDFTTSLTVSLWLNAPTFAAGSADAYDCFVCKGDSAWRVQRANLTRGADFGSTTGGNNTNLDGSDTVDDSTWHLVAISQANGLQAVFVDGELDTSGSAGALDKNALAVVFGENDEASAPRNLKGMMDEIRITSVPRTQAWLRSEFATATHPQTFAALGSAELLP